MVNNVCVEEAELLATRSGLGVFLCMVMEDGSVGCCSSPGFEGAHLFVAGACVCRALADLAKKAHVRDRWLEQSKVFETYGMGGAPEMVIEEAESNFRNVRAYRPGSGREPG